MPRMATSTAIAICAYASPSHCSVSDVIHDRTSLVRQDEEPLRPGEAVDDALRDRHGPDAPRFTYTRNTLTVSSSTSRM